MIIYQCDKCKKQVDKDAVNLLTVQTLDGDVKLENHLCSSCYRNFVSLNHFSSPDNHKEEILDTCEKKNQNPSKIDSLNEIDEKDTEQSCDEYISYLLNEENKIDPIFVRCRDNVTLMKCMIMMYRNLMTNKRTAEYLKVPIANFNFYKKKYYQETAKVRVENAEKYNLLIERKLDFTKFLTLFCGPMGLQGVQLEFDLEEDVVKSLLCFFTNLIPQDWFASTDDVRSKLSTISKDLSNIF